MIEQAASGEFRKWQAVPLFLAALGFCFLVYAFAVQAGHRFGEEVGSSIPAVVLAFLIVGGFVGRGRRVVGGQLVYWFVGIAFSQALALYLLPYLSFPRGGFLAAFALLLLIPAILLGRILAADARGLLPWFAAGCSTGLFMMNLPILWEGQQFPHLIWAGGLVTAVAALVASLRPFTLSGMVLSSGMLLVSFALPHQGVLQGFHDPLITPYATAFFRLPRERQQSAITQWHGNLREDRVPMEGNDPLALAYSNGAAPVTVSKRSPVSGPHGSEDFPMLAWLFEALRPQTLLAIGPVEGPSLGIAARKGVAVAETITSMQCLRSLPPFLQGCGLSWKVNARQTGRKWDMILLNVPLMRASWGIESGGVRDTDVTREALQTYWDTLSDHGVLVITAADEAVFSRLLLTTWSLIESVAATVDEGPVARIRGYRVDPMALSHSHVQYLLIVSKGDSAMVGEQLGKAMAHYPVQAILGPGQRVSPPYDSLYGIAGTAQVYKRFQKYFAKRDLQRLDFRVLDDAGSPISAMVLDLHPWHRMLWTLGVLPAIAVALLALPGRRSLAADWERRYPSIAWILWACVGAGIVMVLASGGLSRVWSQAGFPGTVVATFPLALLALGAVCGMIFFHKWSWKFPSAVGWMLVSLGLIISGVMAAREFWSTVLLAALTLFSGVGLAIALLQFLRGLQGLDDKVAGWGMIAAAAGTLMGPGIEAWCIRSQGVAVLWVLLLVLTVVLLFTDMWIAVRAPSRPARGGACTSP